MTKQKIEFALAERSVDQGALAIGWLMADGEALLDASREGQQAQVEALLSKGVSINFASPGGVTALHWAIIKGRSSTGAPSCPDSRA